MRNIWETMKGSTTDVLRTCIFRILLKKHNPDPISTHWSLSCSPGGVTCQQTCISTNFNKMVLKWSDLDPTKNKIHRMRSSFEISQPVNCQVPNTKTCLWTYGSYCDNWRNRSRFQCYKMTSNSEESCPVKVLCKAFMPTVRNRNEFKGL